MQLRLGFLLRASGFSSTSAHHHAVGAVITRGQEDML